ncbi:hypothetical protein GF324_03945 [bacterium]|nr:hypothetical protein [bacterium]
MTSGNDSETTVQQADETARLRRVHDVVRVALFIATAVASGYLLMAVPNVELITTVVALSGLLLGAWRGLLIGGASMLLYGALNAWGPAYPPLWAMQITGMILTGLVFGLLRNWLLSLARPLTRAFFFGLVGGVMTLLYDILTNLAFPLAARMPMSGVLTTLTAGIPFALVHIGSNVAISAVVLPVVAKRLERRFR